MTPAAENPAAGSTLDLICMGRTCVDLYGEQEGARLEDTASFRKYVGGSATNVAVGTSRLGVESAMLTRVGDEQMGRFVRSTLAENGVNVGSVKDRKSTRLNSSHSGESRMPSSA